MLITSCRGAHTSHSSWSVHRSAVLYSCPDLEIIRGERQSGQECTRAGRLAAARGSISAPKNGPNIIGGCPVSGSADSERATAAAVGEAKHMMPAKLSSFVRVEPLCPTSLPTVHREMSDAGARRPSTSDAETRSSRPAHLAASTSTRCRANPISDRS